LSSAALSSPYEHFARGPSVHGVAIAAGWAPTPAMLTVAAVAGVPAKATAAKAVTPAAGSPAANRRVKVMRSIRSVADDPVLTETV
jgi:hypothetical protein